MRKGPKCYFSAADIEAAKLLASQGEEAIREAEESEDLMIVSRALYARTLLQKTSSPMPRFKTPELVRGQRNVVVIEDDETLRKLTERMAASLGYKVEAFAEAMEVLSYFRKECQRDRFTPDEVDLIISDVGLHGMNGIELAEELHKMRPDIKILFVSGYEIETELENTSVPEYLFLQKPFTRSDLSDVLQQLLPNKKQKE